MYIEREIYINTYIHIYIYIHTHYMCIYIYTHIYIYIYIHMTKPRGRRNLGRSSRGREKHALTPFVCTKESTGLARD